jgi:starch synthase
MILLAHPTANQNVRQAAEALAAAGLLAEFWTCVSWKEGGVADRLVGLNSSLASALRRRSFSPRLQRFIRTSPSRELLRRLSSARLPGTSIHDVYHALDRRVARRTADLKQLDAVYCYDEGALETFRIAKRRGLKCVYEHPIAYWRVVRELQKEEAELYPEWAPTLAALGEGDEKYARKDEELSLADVVIVASTFSKHSLSQAPQSPKQVRVIPYGAPAARAEVSPRQSPNLRVLFVGSLTQAKGLGYLLQAAEMTAATIELTLIGQRVSSTVPTAATLAAHRWIQSLPHSLLLDEMSRHDVLVFPSLHDGFGLVLLEAMAQGVTVIATPNTGGPDLIEEGIDGFVVPIRSAEAIAEKLELLAADGDQLAAMKQAARRKAESRQWAIYRQQIVALAQELML